MRAFYIPVVGLIALFVATFSSAGETKTEPPKIAFYTLTPAIQDSQWIPVASNLSELLRIKLGESERLELLDRSLILNVFGEKTLPMQQSSSGTDGLALDKVPVSQYIVTGVLLNAGQDASVVLKVVDSETGRILASTQRPFSPADVSTLVDQLDQFIHKATRTRDRGKNREARAIGIGNFINISRDNTGAGRGDEIREQLIDHYLGKTDFKVLTRAQVYPLALEAHLKRLQYSSGTRKLERPTTSLYLHGRYRVTGRGPGVQISLYLYLDLIGKKRIPLTVIASTWKGVYQKLNKMVDDIVYAKPEPVADADIVRSEQFYQQGIKAANFGQGPRTWKNGKTWSYPSLYWGKDQHPDIDSAISHFETSVILNPYYDEPRVALAFCLLEAGQEDIAYHHLERVLLNSDNRILLELAERFLRTRPITADMLDGISDDSEELYNALVAGLYIEKDGDDLVGIRSVSNARSIDLPAYTIRQREMVLQIIRPTWSPPNKKNLFNGKRYDRETEYHFYLGEWLGQIIYTGRQFDIPSINTSNMNDLASDQQSVENLRAAFDEYSTALYLEGDFYGAMTYLGYIMRTRTIRQYTHANMWFEYVTRNSPDDNWKFLAADAIDKVADMKFSDNFSYFVNIERHLVKKHVARLKKISSTHKFSDGDQSAALLRDAYLASLSASCENTLWAAKRKPSHLGRGLRLDIFEELTIQGKTSEPAARARLDILNQLTEKYPRVAPYFVMSKNFDIPAIIDEQTAVLSKINKGHIQPISNDLFDRQVERILSGWLQRRVHPKASERFAEYLVNSSPTRVHRKFVLASLYHQHGKPDKAELLLKGPSVPAYQIAELEDPTFNGVYRFHRLSAEGYPVFKQEKTDDGSLRYIGKNASLTGNWKLYRGDLEQYTSPRISYGSVPSGKKGWRSVTAKRSTPVVMTLLPNTQVATTEVRNDPGPGQKIALQPFPQDIDKRRTFRGSSVDLYNDYAITGVLLARVKDWHGARAGAATIYQYSSGKWSPVTQLAGNKPITMRSRDWFGASVDMHDDYVIVGAPLDDDKGPLLPEYFPSHGLGERYQAKGLIEKLFEKGYLDVYGLVTDKFKGVTDDLRADFPDLSQNEAYQLVKAVNHSADLTNSGTAHIFHRTGINWESEGTLIASNAKAKMKFGVDVAIHKEHSLVCATGLYENESTIMSSANTMYGGAYLFKKIQGRWIEETKLVTAKCKAVALDGEWAMVGARRPDKPGGTVYVFKRQNGQWEKYQELVADDFTSDGREFFAYGSALDLSGNYAVIGNPQDSHGNTRKWAQAGSAYVFKYEGGKWIQKQKLERKFDTKGYGNFGSAVSLQGDRILVGAPGTAGRAEKARKVGKAYIFKREGNHWSFVEELSPAADTSGEHFGAAAAIGRRSALVGAPGPDGHGKIYFHHGP